MTMRAMTTMTLLGALNPAALKTIAPVVSAGADRAEVRPQFAESMADVVASSLPSMRGAASLPSEPLTVDSPNVPTMRGQRLQETGSSGVAVPMPTSQKLPGPPQSVSAAPITMQPANKSQSTAAVVVPETPHTESMGSVKPAKVEVVEEKWETQEAEPKLPLEIAGTSPRLAAAGPPVKADTIAPSEPKTSKSTKDGKIEHPKSSVGRKSERAASPQAALASVATPPAMDASSVVVEEVAPRPPVDATEDHSTAIIDVTSLPQTVKQTSLAKLPMQVQAVGTATVSASGKEFASPDVSMPSMVTDDSAGPHETQAAAVAPALVPTVSSDGAPVIGPATVKTIRKTTGTDARATQQRTFHASSGVSPMTASSEVVSRTVAPSTIASASIAVPQAVAATHTLTSDAAILTPVAIPANLASTVAPPHQADHLSPMNPDALSSAAPSSSQDPVQPTPAHTMLNASPTVLEVGVPGGSHGWLKIRAEIDPSGNVQASLSPATHAAHETLHRDLPEMTAFLASEQLPVQLHVVEAPRSAASLDQDFTQSTTTGERSGSERQNPSGQQSEASFIDGDDESWSAVDYGALRGGSWLNVVA